MKHLHRTATNYRVRHCVPNADQLQVFLHLVDVYLGVRVEQAKTKLTNRERKWSIALACLERKAGGEAVCGEHRRDDVHILHTVWEWFDFRVRCGSGLGVEFRVMGLQFMI